MSYYDLMKIYLEGNATEEQRKQLEDYIAASEDNRKEYLMFRNMWELSESPFSESDIDVKKAKKRLSPYIDEHRLSFGGRVLSFWKSVAAVIVVPLLALSAYLSYELLVKSNRQVSDVVLSAPYGSIVNTVLPDGSKVCLNSGSELKYSSDYISAGRKVWLDGEAYFDVKADSGNTFAVLLPDGVDVTAVGTSFNVDSDDAGNVSVALVDGKLDVGCSGKKYRMTQGTLLVKTEDKVDMRHDVDLFRWVSWKDGILAFRGDDLEYVFDKLSDIFNVDITVKDDEINSLKLRATFADERIEEILSVMEQVLPIDCERVPTVDTLDLKKKFVISSK